MTTTTTTRATASRRSSSRRRRRIGEVTARAYAIDLGAPADRRGRAPGSLGGRRGGRRCASAGGVAPRGSTRGPLTRGGGGFACDPRRVGSPAGFGGVGVGVGSVLGGATATLAGAATAGPGVPRIA